MLGRNGSPTDDEEVHPGLDNCTPVALGTLRRKFSGDNDTRLANILQTFGDEVFLNGGGIDLLQTRNRAICR